MIGKIEMGSASLLFYFTSFRLIGNGSILNSDWFKASFKKEHFTGIPEN